MKISSTQRLTCQTHHLISGENSWLFVGVIYGLNLYKDCLDRQVGLTWMIFVHVFANRVSTPINPVTNGTMKLFAWDDFLLMTFGNVSANWRLLVKGWLWSRCHFNLFLSNSIFSGFESHGRIFVSFMFSLNLNEKKKQLIILNELV